MEGGRELLSRWAPPINIELEEVHRPGCTVGIPKFLDALGYEGFFIYKEQLMRFEDFDTKKHQICGTDGVGAWDRKGYYVFDFQFIHKDDRWSHDRLKEIYSSTGLCHVA